MSMNCRKCGKSVHEIGNRYLTRVNEKGIPGIWECVPPCDLPLSEYATSNEAVIAAIEGGLQT